MNLPIHCGHRNCARLAGHLVTGATRAKTACHQHLEAVKQWVGDGAQTTPVVQPAGHDPPAAEQQEALF